MRYSLHHLGRLFGSKKKKKKNHFGSEASKTPPAFHEGNFIQLEVDDALDRAHVQQEVNDPEAHLTRRCNDEGLSSSFSFTGHQASSSTFQALADIPATQEIFVVKDVSHNNSTTAMVPAKDACYFMRLPPEMRVMIYQHIIEHTLRTSPHCPAPLSPALCQVTRTIRNECLPMVLQGCELCIRCWFPSLDCLRSPPSYVPVATVEVQGTGRKFFAGWSGVCGPLFDSTFHFLGKVSISFLFEGSKYDGPRGQLVIRFYKTTYEYHFKLDEIDTSSPGMTRRDYIVIKPLEEAFLSTLIIWSLRAKDRGEPFYYSHGLMMSLYGHIKYYMACIRDERRISALVA